MGVPSLYGDEYRYFGWVLGCHFCVVLLVRERNKHKLNIFAPRTAINYL